MIIKPGDYVQINSGSEPLLVIFVGDDEVYFEWSVGLTRHVDCLPIVCVRRAPAPKLTLVQ